MLYHQSAHAGESSGPQGVRDALEFLHADRIDHGVRAIEDPELVKILAEKGIPLGICPTSNLTLGLYPKLDQHPLEQLRRAGVPVSINTDDPAPLGLALHSEYQKCASAFNWSVSELQSVAKTSIEASFADADTKKRLLQELADWDEGFEPGDR
jgi:adenosine deaminase